MKATSLVLMLAAPLAGELPPASAEGRLSMEACQVEVSIPEGWEALVQTQPEDGVWCAILMRPGEWPAEVDESEIGWSHFPLALRLYDQPFEQTAKSAGFERKGDKWVVHGRQDAAVGAQVIEGTGWTALVGEPTIGMHYKRGGNAGLGDTFRAAIRPRSGLPAILDLEAGRFKVEAKSILRSLRYKGARKK